jgi:hypothetical protein
MEDETFKVPAKAAFEFITPEAAKHLLDSGPNRRNRKVMDPAKKRLQGVIKRGEWMYDSTDAIGLDSEGAVINGQHRLAAISEGDQGVWALVVRGVRPEVIKVIDQPTMRTIQQALEIDGRFPEPGPLASALKDIHKYLVHGFKKTLPTEYKPTIPQLLELLSQHPHLVDSLGLAGKVYRNPYKALPKGTWTALHYAFSCADAELADTFLTAIATGEDINDGDPAYLLRERFFITEPGKANDTRKRTLEPHEAVSLAIMAWEATRSGGLSAKETRLLRTGFPLAATPMPQVTSVPWLARDEAAA